MKRLTVILMLSMLMALPAQASEDYADGDSEQVYTWIQEGDSVFCYINNGGWSEADMLTGFHTIEGETYYFYEMEMEDYRYGEMATGEVWMGAWTFYFDSEGHLYDAEEGLNGANY